MIDLDRIEAEISGADVIGPWELDTITKLIAEVRAGRILRSALGTLYTGHADDCDYSGWEDPPIPCNCGFHPWERALKKYDDAVKEKGE